MPETDLQKIAEPVRQLLVERLGARNEASQRFALIVLQALVKNDQLLSLLKKES